MKTITKKYLISPLLFYCATLNLAGCSKIGNRMNMDQQDQDPIENNQQVAIVEHEALLNPNIVNDALQNFKRAIVRLNLDNDAAFNIFIQAVEQVIGRVNPINLTNQDLSNIVTNFITNLRNGNNNLQTAYNFLKCQIHQNAVKGIAEYNGYSSKDATRYEKNNKNFDSFLDEHVVKCTHCTNNQASNFKSYDEFQQNIYARTVMVYQIVYYAYVIVGRIAHRLNNTNVFTKCDENIKLCLNRIRAHQGNPHYQGWLDAINIGQNNLLGIQE